MTKLAELKRKRSSYKSKLTQFKSYVTLISSCEKPSQIQLSDLNVRLSKIEEWYGEFDALQIEIESCMDISESDCEKEYQYRELFEVEYFATVGSARELVSRFTSAQPSKDDAASTSSASGTVLTADKTQTLKLPVIQLPTFSGNFEDWLRFHDTFVSLIHLNDSIPKINKFHYLHSSLKDKAANVIGSLEFSAANYDIAWQLLCERYHNNKVLISNHIQALFDIEPILRESATSLRHLNDNLNKNLRALETLNISTRNWDTLLIHLVSSKLDNITNRKWKEYTSNFEKLPDLDQFTKFIKDRACLLETINMTHSKRRHSEPTPTGSRPRVFVANLENNNRSSFTCPSCKQQHAIYQCPKFKSLSIHSRINRVKQLKLCLNCLRHGHDVNKCRFGPCRICAKWHNTLLHHTEEVTSSEPKGPAPPASSSKEVQNDTSEVVLSSIHDTCVLLSTVLIHVFGTDGSCFTVRALLDNGSTSNFITEGLRQKLNIPSYGTSTSVEGLSRESIKINKRAVISIKSRTENYSANIDCFVLPQITQKLPAIKFDTKMLNIPEGITLADPNFNIPNSVDMLLGADVFWTVLGGERIPLGRNRPMLNNTRFGWLVSGSIPFRRVDTIQCPHNNTVHCNFINDIELQNKLDKFFELESIPSPRSTTKQENDCELHFTSTTTRQNDGRFIVQIPLKQSPVTLGESYDQAFQRFQSLERKFARFPLFKEKYCDFMQEYIDLGHMSLNVNSHTDDYSYILPHHGVLKESSLSTKLRVVFDASAKTTSGLSFNNIQNIGPTVQDDLISILIRFRQHKYVVTSDCEKMYRCVLVDENQRCLQQTLWRFDPSQEIKIYKLNTVTYGTASAPYLATRCLVQLGQECLDPLVRETILHDCYVDDYISGHDSKSTLKDIIKGVITQLKKGQFYLRKWRSNCPDILMDVKGDKDNDNLLKLVNDDDAKTLGLRWSCKSDTLLFSVDIDSSQNRLSKRSVLSTVGQIFDPLGLVNPCILQGKIILQKLWASKVSWEDPLPPKLETDWLTFFKSLSLLNEIRIPRHILSTSYTLIEIHAFSDASLHAYSACIYIRSISADGDVKVHLMMSKSKVAPLKGMTMPRLELCGALLAIRLAHKVKTSLRLKVDRSVYWCDSTIVLGWIRAPRSTLKTFVLNRINEITEYTEPEAWRYVPTNLNPADIGSRGCNARQLQSSSLWFSGPSFLTKNESSWPMQPNHTLSSLPETKVECNFVTEQHNYTSRYSNFCKLQRITGYLLRFIHNCRNPASRLTGHLSVTELNLATYTLCRIIQLDAFTKEYKILQHNKNLPSKSKLLNLNPFMSNNNLIRVGGRLSNSNYDYDTKHPILLHSSHNITKLLVQHYHKLLMHAGPQLLLSTLRHKFWIIGGRNLVRKITHECHKCCRFAGRTNQPIMADLPKERLHSQFPFLNTAVDYAGPILIANKKGRGCKLIKSYICVFVCLAVRAVHLELVTDLSTETFLAALSRFVARRGKPVYIYSDNGTNFVGANNELSKFLKTKCNDISSKTAEQSITFKFSPAYSPHFNGLAESSVKSVKHHLNRVLSLAHLTYEEMNTVLVGIEGILNSRPLTSLSSDPNDLIPLTPSHFLIGRTITMLPQSPIDMEETTRIHALPRYQRAQLLTQHFWNRYYLEYISNLQKRNKWHHSTGRSLQLGDLVVIKEDRLPPNRWLLGRISRLHPGSDGIARVAEVTTSTGILRRAYNRLCLLPTQDTLDLEAPTRGAC